MDDKFINELAAAVDERVDNRVNAKISDLEAEIVKMKSGNAGSSLPGKSDSAHMKAFTAALRTGKDSELMTIQAAMSTGSDPDGGYMVPEVIDSQIAALMLAANPMRQLATVLPVSSPNYSKLINKHGSASGWVGETAARPETATPELSALTPFWGELYANPFASQSLVEDSAFDIERFLVDEISEKFTSDEGSAFITGNGILKPKGILDYPTATTADGVRAFGTIQHLVTGAGADFIVPTATASPADVLIDMVFSLKAKHRANGAWLMNAKTLSKVRKFKEAVNGMFIFQPSLVAGTPSMILGYPVYECEDMPDVGANTLPVAFADMAAAYYICDRIGWSLLRDPYSAKPNISFYCRKRVGGMLVNSEAIKLLKVSA